MEATRLSELTPRSVWDIVDDAFDLYRERFVLLFGAAAVIYVPALLLRLFFLAGLYSRYYRATATAGYDPSAAFGASGGLFGGSMLVMPVILLTAGLYSGAAAVVVRDHLGPRQITTIKEAYAPALRRLGRLVGAIVLGVLATAVGYGFCFLPAVYVGIVLSFLPQVVILEDKRINAAFKRSQDLARPHFGLVFGMVFLLGAMSVLLSGGAVLLIKSIYAALPQSGDSAALQTQQALVQESISGIAGLFLAPLSSIALTLLYFDIRVRREGLDIAARAAEVGFPLADDPYGDMPSEEARRRAARGGRR